MNLLRRTLLALLPLLAACGTAEPKPEDGWIPLFNGRDLSGWTPKIAGLPLGEDPLGTFRVEDGLLKVRYDRYSTFEGRFGHLFHERDWSRYRMRVEYRFLDHACLGAPGWAYRNSGVMVHGQPPETMGLEQSFPVSIEVQLLGGDGSGPRPTANLCTPGTHVEIGGDLVTRHVTNSSAPTFDGDQWVTVEFEVLGNQTIRHFVNGQLVLEYGRPQLDPGDANAAPLLERLPLQLASGSISLQGEGHALDFRRVEILPLEE